MIVIIPFKYMYISVPSISDLMLVDFVITFPQNLGDIIIPKI